MSVNDHKADGAVREVKFVDVFAGIGGITLGLLDGEAEPSCRFVPRLLVDIDRTARDVAVRNMPRVPYLVADVHQLSGSEIKRRAGLRDDERLDMLVGGPPCQGFSFLGKRTLDDERNLHIVDYLRLCSVEILKVTIRPGSSGYASRL